MTVHFSAGIGEATCKLLAKDGMKVVGCARRVEKIEALAKDTGLKIWPYKVSTAVFNSIGWSSH